MYVHMPAPIAPQPEGYKVLTYARFVVGFLAAVFFCPVIRHAWLKLLKTCREASSVVPKRPKPASNPPLRSLALIRELLFFYAEQVRQYMPSRTLSRFSFHSRCLPITLSCSCNTVRETVYAVQNEYGNS
jgi:hypothetical protein